MKKTIKLLSVLLGIILALTPVLSLTVSADDAANGQTSTYNAEYQNAKGKLAITEINAGGKNETNYQFVEVVNVSSQVIDLANYYIYRSMSSNGSSNWSKLVMDYVLSVKSQNTHTVARIKVTDTSTTISGGEVAILWFRTDSTLTVDDFKTEWTSVPENTKIIIVNVDKSIYAANANVAINQFSGDGFLPNACAQGSIQLIHKDAQFVNANDETVTIANDNFTTAKNDMSDKTLPTYYSNNIARIGVADCSAVFYTSHSTNENKTTSHHYYGFLDNAKYQTEVVEFGATFSGNFDSFVSGKMPETGKYDSSSGAGITLYKNNGSTTDPTAYFVDDGTKATANPGTLNAGQFGYNSIKVLGYQTNNENDLRIVASFEADALMANAVGFEIVANIGGIEKKLDQECYKVYAKLGGSVKVGENTVSPLDQDYLATVGTHEYYVALTITDIDVDVTFTVKPYVLNGTLKQYGETATITYTAPEA